MHHVELADILSEIHSHKFFENLKHSILLTREEWSGVIGIHRNTVSRWEQNIIQKVTPVRNDYFHNSMRGNYLDSYQRFILIVIFIVKGGLENKNSFHADTINFLKTNFDNLQRKHFEEWINANT